MSEILSSQESSRGADLSAHGGWPGVIGALLAGRDLDAAPARAAMEEILSGAATPAQIIGFVVALRAKGETATELSGLLDAVLAAATEVPLRSDVQDRAIDIVGTGGDQSHSINVSTIAAIVTAGAGVPVCKHGNRASSSQCGTADVLEALGVAIDLGPEGVAACIERAGIGFCLAPRYHPAFKYAGPPRREIGVPTVFNLLGPMANPARVRHQLIGVADARFAAQMLDTLRAHGSISAWVVHGNGLDELATTGVSEVMALTNGEIRSFQVDPTALGLAPATTQDLRGGDAHHNAQAVRSVLSGELGAHRDVVVLNAGAALVVAGVAQDLATGLALASASIDEGRAMAALNDLIDESGRQADIERAKTGELLG
jgi:anthranilate phosphoribosyltransferase